MDNGPGKFQNLQKRHIWKAYDEDTHYLIGIWPWPVWLYDFIKNNLLSTIAFCSPLFSQTESDTHVLISSMKTIHIFLIIKFIFLLYCTILTTHELCCFFCHGLVSLCIKCNSTQSKWDWLLIKDMAFPVWRRLWMTSMLSILQVWDQIILLI